MIFIFSQCLNFLLKYHALTEDIVHIIYDLIKKAILHV